MKYHDALARLRNVTVHPGYATARCPAHGDNSPSLSVLRLPNDEAYFTCFAGCDFRAVSEAVKGGSPVGNDTIDIVVTTRDTTEYALDMWRDSFPVIFDTPVHRYFSRRGIPLPATRDIRYLAQAHHADGSFWPAMIAAITNIDHEITGIHRTFLTPEGH